MDEYQDRLASLPDAAYETAKAQLRVEEERLKRGLNDYVSRTAIKQMFEEAINYAHFKHKIVKPQVREEQPESPEELGSTRTIRKVVLTKPRISDEAKAIAAETAKTKNPISAEKTQAMLDTGEI